MSDKTCDYCGTLAGTKNSAGIEIKEIKPFDMTGRKFCNLDCFRSFYETKSSQVQPTEELDIKTIASIEEHENAWCAPYDGIKTPVERSMEMLEKRITTLRALQREYRLRELIARKHVLKVNAQNEADKTERFRKYGVNSDTERAEQKLNAVQKMIQRYKKMGMSAENIYENFKDMLDISLENLKDEYSKL